MDKDLAEILKNVLDVLDKTDLLEKTLSKRAYKEIVLDVMTTHIEMAYAVGYRNGLKLAVKKNEEMLDKIDKHTFNWDDQRTWT